MCTHQVWYQTPKGKISKNKIDSIDQNSWRRDHLSWVSPIPDNSWYTARCSKRRKDQYVLALHFAFSPFAGREISPCLFSRKGLVARFTPAPMTAFQLKLRRSLKMQYVEYLLRFQNLAVCVLAMRWPDLCGRVYILVASLREKCCTWMSEWTK